MLCQDDIDVARALVRVLRADDSDAVKVVAIAGYPYTGKSYLAQELVGAWPNRNGVVVPTESVIQSRRDRLAQGLDGCDEAAHDVARLAALCRALLGRSVVEVPSYSWDLGAHQGTYMLGLQQGPGLIVVDGSVSVARRLASLVDLAVTLSPSDRYKWMDQVVERDVASRSWDSASAIDQNVAKEGTVRTQMDQLGTVAHVDLWVDTSTWRVQVVNCSGCLSESNRDRVDVVDPSPCCVLCD